MFTGCMLRKNEVGTTLLQVFGQILHTIEDVQKLVLQAGLKRHEEHTDLLGGLVVAVRLFSVVVEHTPTHDVAHLVGAAGIGLAHMCRKGTAVTLAVCPHRRTCVGAVVVEVLLDECGVGFFRKRHRCAVAKTPHHIGCSQICADGELTSQERLIFAKGLHILLQLHESQKAPCAERGASSGIWHQRSAERRKLIFAEKRLALFVREKVQLRNPVAKAKPLHGVLARCPKIMLFDESQLFGFLTPHIDFAHAFLQRGTWVHRCRCIARDLHHEMDVQRVFLSIAWGMRAKAQPLPEGAFFVGLRCQIFQTQPLVARVGEVDSYKGVCNFRLIRDTILILSSRNVGSDLLYPLQCFYNIGRIVIDMDKIVP